MNKEKEEFVNGDNNDKLLSDIQTNEQSWKSTMAYMGVATAIGGALLFGLVYMRR
jgi:hypothetical protein